MRRLLPGLLTAIVLSMPGCNIVAGVTYAITPDPSKEAVYTLPDIRTVIFVDDRRNILHPARLRTVIAKHATEMLLKQEVVTVMIEPRDAMRIAAQQDRFERVVAIDAIGRAVDADVVIYVEMTYFGLTSDGQTANPRAGCAVRVIDVANTRRLSPLAADGVDAWVVDARISRVDPHQISDAGEIHDLAEQLAVEMGDQVAKLFYEHTTGRLGENLNRR